MSAAQRKTSVISEQEARVVTYIMYGLRDQAIAEKLGIAHQSVTNHITRIRLISGLDTKTAIVMWALQNKYIKLPGWTLTRDPEPLRGKGGQDD